MGFSIRDSQSSGNLSVYFERIMFNEQNEALQMQKT